MCQGDGVPQGVGQVDEDTACIWRISLWSSPRAAGQLCSGAWNTPSPPSALTLAGVCKAVSLTYFHSSLWLQLLLSSFPNSPFLNLLSQRCYHHCWWAQIQGKLLAVSHRSHSLGPHYQQNLATQTQDICEQWDSSSGTEASQHSLEKRLLGEIMVMFPSSVLHWLYSHFCMRTHASALLWWFRTNTVLVWLIP